MRSLFEQLRQILRTLRENGGPLRAPVLIHTDNVRRDKNWIQQLIQELYPELVALADGDVSKVTIVAQVSTSASFPLKPVFGLRSPTSKETIPIAARSS